MIRFGSDIFIITTFDELYRMASVAQGRKTGIHSMEDGFSPFFSKNHFKVKEETNNLLIF